MFQLFTFRKIRLVSNRHNLLSNDHNQFKSKQCTFKMLFLFLVINFQIINSPVNNKQSDFISPYLGAIHLFIRSDQTSSIPNSLNFFAPRMNFRLFCPRRPPVCGNVKCLLRAWRKSEPLSNFRMLEFRC